MTRFFRLGAAMIVLAGLAACSVKAAPPKSAILDDFERVPDPGLSNRQFDPVEALKKPTYPSHDYDVSTSGYASVTSLSKDAARAARKKDLYKFIQGKYAAQVRFTVPGDYKNDVTDYRKPLDGSAPKPWVTGFGLDIDTHTPLKVTDWSPYRYFDFRAFNPSAMSQLIHIRFNDAASAVTETAVLLPQGECEVEVDLRQLSDARLNPSQIKGFTLYLNTAAQDVDPVLDFDQIALYDIDSAARAKLALEEGEEEENDEDWDSDEDTVRKVTVVHPVGSAPAANPAAASTAVAP